MKDQIFADISARVLLVFATIGIASAQSLASCSPSSTPTKSIRPSVASGFQAALVATGLIKPRSIQFDSSGNLLVVESGSGLSSLQLQDNGGVCVNVRDHKTVIDNSDVSYPVLDDSPNRLNTFYFS